jgi:hypothetical protein
MSAIPIAESMTSPMAPVVLFADDPEVWGGEPLPDENHPLLLALGDAALELLILFRGPEENREFVQRVHAIGQTVMDAAAGDPGIALLSLHRVRKGGYSVWHSIHTATVLAVAAPRLGVKPQRMPQLMAAALTMNIGMSDLQDVLFEQKTPVRPVQKAAVLSHPVRSAQLLRLCGVDDPLWLKLVEQHHEKTDGSGYPNGLREEQISAEARLLQVAELYCALSTPRRYRYTMETPEQFASTLIERSEHLGRHFARLLLKIAGNVPPGTCVALANGEIGEVVGAEAGASYPSVRVAEGRGMGFLRNTGESRFRIVRILDLLPQGMCSYSAKRRLEQGMRLML